MSGQPTRLGEVMHAVSGSAPASSSGAAQFDISSDGTLALLAGGVNPSFTAQLVWMGQDRATEPLALEPGSYLAPRLSPDGSRFAVMVGIGRSDVVGAGDLLSTSIGDATFPVWTPDGSSLMVAAGAGGMRQQIHRVPLSGGTPEPIVTGANLLWPSHVSRDGRWLAYVETHPVSGNDIWVADLGPNRTPPSAVLATTANETHPSFSPDGKWLAYLSDGALYVRPFQGGGRETRIARGPCHAPIWAPDGRAVLFIDIGDSAAAAQRIMRLPIDTSRDRVVVGTPTAVAAGRFASSTPVGGFDVTPDGRRLLVLLATTPPPADDASPPALRLIVHADLSGGARP
jgi:Tol biopolymer transport system component